MLRKGVYPYEYMDDWKKFDKTLLPEREDFYSGLNMVDITTADYTHANGVWYKQFRGGSWFASSKWYIITSWYFYQFSENVSWNI